MATEVLNEQEERAETASPAVELKVIADSTTGYAAIQNNIPVIRSLIVKNNSEEPLCSIDVLVFCTPSEHGATSVSELARTICRLQRIARTTADAEARIARALQVGRTKEFVQLADGTVSLSKSF